MENSERPEKTLTLRARSESESARRRSPEEVVASWERSNKFFQQQHLQSLGRQVSSRKETSPATSFGFRATQQYNSPGRPSWEESKIWKVLDPKAALPGPCYYPVRPPEELKTNPVIGFTGARRFNWQGPVKASPRAARPSSAEADVSEKAESMSPKATARAASPSAASPSKATKPPGSQDLDLKYRYGRTIAYSFGSRMPEPWSGKDRDSASSNAVAPTSARTSLKTTARLRTFRELREEVPQPSSKEPIFGTSSARRNGAATS